MSPEHWSSSIQPLRPGDRTSGSCHAALSQTADPSASAAERRAAAHRAGRAKDHIFYFVCFEKKEC